MNQTLKQAFDQASQLSLSAQNAIAQIILNEIKNNQEDEEDSKNQKLQESQEVSAYDLAKEWAGSVAGLVIYLLIKSICKDLVNNEIRNYYRYFSLSCFY
jgi:hypothetical protein